MSKRTIRINEVCELNSETIKNGNIPETIKYLDTGSITRNRIEGVQLLNIKKDAIPSRAQRKVKEGTIIYSTVRPIQEHFGFLIDPEENLIVSTGFLTIDVKDEDIDAQYLYYLITQKNITNYLQTVASNNVSSYPSINPDDLGNLKFVIPSEKVKQQRIATVLSSLDAKIELNNRINAELEAMAKTLYDYWFVQFDFPNEKGKSYKSSGGKMVWNEELKREIPLGWEVKKVGDFANTSSGGTPLSTKQEYYGGGTIPWINSGELNDPFIVKGSSFITEEGLNNSSAKIFPANTVLVALYGATAGKVSLLKIEACTNQAVCGIIPSSQIYINFLKYSFENLYKYMVAISSGSARDNLSQDIIRNITFAMPQDEKLFERFNKIVNPMLEKIVSNLLENQNLSSLRDWLLPMLMNGQVRVG